MVLSGSSINQDGRSSTLTAPNGPSQQEVVRTALLDSNITAHEVCIIEMHGTGTSLGDPIELGALKKVFENSERAFPLTLSSSKSWVGHAEPAAGINGLLNAISAVQNHSTRPIMHLTAMNPYIVNLMSSESSYGAQKTLSLDIPRGYSKLECTDTNGIRAGVSSFAFQGTNCHMLLGKGYAFAGMNKVGNG
jgi:acyl transferase domain-containing protein